MFIMNAIFCLFLFFILQNMVATFIILPSSVQLVLKLNGLEVHRPCSYTGLEDTLILFVYKKVRGTQIFVMKIYILHFLSHTGFFFLTKI